MEPTSIPNTPASAGLPVADAQDSAIPSAAGDVSLKDLEACVQRLLGRRLRDFQITAARDGLIMKGTSTSWCAKQLAQHAVLTVARLPLIANEIEVC